ncbi:MAG: hypothetical protein U1C53_00615, partial [Candidatus Veblenbacteria bacterium]|nr:hypothetical protein [Candidatus Veblenbacteria bacterium]
DRHNDIMENSNELSNWPYKSSIFVLPFENYVHHYRDKKGVFEATAKPEHIFMILAESLGIS